MVMLLNKGESERMTKGKERERRKDMAPPSCVLPQLLGTAAPKPDCSETEEGEEFSGRDGLHTADP